MHQVGCIKCWSLLMMWKSTCSNGQFLQTYSIHTIPTLPCHLLYRICLQFNRMQSYYKKTRGIRRKRPLSPRNVIQSSFESDILKQQCHSTSPLRRQQYSFFFSPFPHHFFCPSAPPPAPPNRSFVSHAVCLIFPSR